MRFDGEQKEAIPRSRTHSGRQTRNSGRRRKGSRQRKHSSEHRLIDQPSHTSKHKHEHHRKSSRSSRSSNEPCTSAQAKLRADGSDASSLCSTCSSSSSESDDFAYKLPQRKIYGGVRISYVPNDALACARKEQQKKQMPTPNANKKFLAMFNFL